MPRKEARASWSLPVALDCRRVAGLGVVGVESGPPAGTPLPEQIPELVELRLERLESRPLLGRQRRAVALGTFEGVLLVDELVDVLDDLTVVSHPATLTGCASRQTGRCRSARSDLVGAAPRAR